MKVEDNKYFNDPVNQVDELKYIAKKLGKNFSTEIYVETIIQVAESIEAKTMHTFSPTEFGGDICRHCGHDIRLWPHLVGARR